MNKYSELYKTAYQITTGYSPVIAGGLAGGTAGGIAGGIGGGAIGALAQLAKEKEDRDYAEGIAKGSLIGGGVGVVGGGVLGAGGGGAMRSMLLEVLNKNPRTNTLGIMSTVPGAFDRSKLTPGGDMNVNFSDILKYYNSSGGDR